MAIEQIDPNEVFTPESQERIREEGIRFTNANLDEMIGLATVFAREPGPASDPTKFSVAFEMALGVYLVPIMAYCLVIMPRMSDEDITAMITERVTRYIAPARELQGAYYEQHAIQPPAVN